MVSQDNLEFAYSFLFAVVFLAICVWHWRKIK